MIGDRRHNSGQNKTDIVVCNTGITLTGIIHRAYQYSKQENDFIEMQSIDIITKKY
jgi:hypothetical protein